MLTNVLIASATLGVGAQDLKSGLVMSNLDSNVRPQDDFYEYACGGWMKSNPLPAAYSRYGSFDRLQEDNDKRINSILDEMLKGSYQKGSVEQKLSDFYKLAMDQKRRNKEGVSPVMPIIKKMEAAQTKEQLFEIQKELMQYGDQQFMYMGFGADDKNATENILNIYQGGLTLGQKEYYLDNDEATAKIRAAYKNHIVTMFQLFGFKKGVAQQKMEQVLKIETALAKVSKNRTELRDVEANYNKMTLKEFEQKYPHVQLSQLAQAEGVDLKYIQDMIVGQPDFVAGADKVIAEMTADEYRAYMEWGEITSAASYLSDKVVAANFDFFGKTMRGRKENFPLWKRATGQVESQMGEALGRIYCERYFPASSKERMERLVKNLQLSLAERIMAQDWMETDTKLNALSKLSTFYVKIGYPDKWKDLSALNIDPSKSFYENVMECNKFQTKRHIEEKAGKPVNRDEWHMTPQTVNAYYNPTTNEICFPAGILQPPFFDMNADDATNYGAIGVVIGHEMTHGFDDQGSQYDKNGNLQAWWKESDVNAFKLATEQMAVYFDSLWVIPGELRSNGHQCLGENIADHGGINVAYDALQMAQKRHGRLPDENGFTPEQRFFLSFANVWAGVSSEEILRYLTINDVHSANHLRVNGGVAQCDYWYKAFNIKPDAKLYVDPKNRVKIW